MSARSSTECVPSHVALISAVTVSSLPSELKEAFKASPALPSNLNTPSTNISILAPEVSITEDFLIALLNLITNSLALIALILDQQSIILHLKFQYVSKSLYS